METSWKFCNKYDCGVFKFSELTVFVKHFLTRASVDY